eukprot:318477-Pelagomonas_calceolata.AAC.2
MQAHKLFQITWCVKMQDVPFKEESQVDSNTIPLTCKEEDVMRAMILFQQARMSGSCCMVNQAG